MRSITRLLTATAFLALAGSLAMPDTAQAIPARLKANIEAAKDEVKTSKKLMKDDKKDLKAIEKIARKWLDAREDGNASKMAKADEDLLEWLREELQENREDRARARAEMEAVGASASTGTDRRGRPTNARSRRAPETPRQTDAREDFEAEEADARATRAIAEDLRDLQRRFEAGTAGPQVQQQKADLLRDLVRGARRDLRRSTRELAEDEAHLEQLKDRR